MLHGVEVQFRIGTEGDGEAAEELPEPMSARKVRSIPSEDLPQSDKKRAV